MMVLKFGALDIPLWAGPDISQAYEKFGGESILRTVNGSGLKQSTYQKTRITTSGSGRLPAGLESINTNAQFTLSCIVPVAVPAVFATRQATLPLTRRSDTGHVPWGFAILADGTPVKTPASVASNVATLTAVTGAVAYQACYLPQYTVWALRPVVSGDRKPATYAWEIVCEEV